MVPMKNNIIYLSTKKPTEKIEEFIEFMCQSNLIWIQLISPRSVTKKFLDLNVGVDSNKEQLKFIGVVCENIVAGMRLVSELPVYYIEEINSQPHNLLKFDLTEFGIKEEVVYNR